MLSVLTSLGFHTLVFFASMCLRQSRPDRSCLQGSYINYNLLPQKSDFPLKILLAQIFPFANKAVFSFPFLTPSSICPVPLMECVCVRANLSGLWKGPAAPACSLHARSRLCHFTSVPGSKCVCVRVRTHVRPACQMSQGLTSFAGLRRVYF